MSSPSFPNSTHHHPHPYPTGNLDCFFIPWHVCGVLFIHTCLFSGFGMGWVGWIWMDRSGGMAFLVTCALPLNYFIIVSFREEFSPCVSTCAREDV